MPDTDDACFGTLFIFLKPSDRLSPKSSCMNPTENCREFSFSRSPVRFDFRARMKKRRQENIWRLHSLKLGTSSTLDRILELYSRASRLRATSGSTARSQNSNFNKNSCKLLICLFHLKKTSDERIANTLRSCGEG